MSKEDYLNLLKLLSAIESWAFSTQARLPDYLHDRLLESVEKLSSEVLK